MKKWIHAKSDAASIDYKIKDFLADWAKKDAQKGKPAVSMKDFKEAMKDEDLKADQDRYDYYLECYNNAKAGKKSVNSSVVAGTESDILEDIHERMDDEFDVLFYGDEKYAKDYAGRGGNVYVFTTKGGTNGYRVFFDTENNELIFQQLAVAFYDDNGDLWFDEAVDYKSAYGNELNNHKWFDQVVRWVRQCEAEDPNFTEYEE